MSQHFVSSVIPWPDIRCQKGDKFQEMLRSLLYDISSVGSSFNFLPLGYGYCPSVFALWRLSYQGMEEGKGLFCP